jgi:hypothetical protein
VATNFHGSARNAAISAAVGKGASGLDGAVAGLGLYTQGASKNAFTSASVMRDILSLIGESLQERDFSKERTTTSDFQLFIGVEQ